MRTSGRESLRDEMDETDEAGEAGRGIGGSGKSGHVQGLRSGWDEAEWGGKGREWGGRGGAWRLGRFGTVAAWCPCFS